MDGWMVVVGVRMIWAGRHGWWVRNVESKRIPCLLGDIYSSSTDYTTVVLDINTAFSKPKTYVRTARAQQYA